VLNLSPDKPAAFAEIARVLKPGGRIRISDIVVDGLPQWVRDSTALYSSCVAGAISEPEYLAGLRAAGLEDVQVVKRLVYDRAMLGGLIASEVEEGGDALVAEAARILSGAACGCGCTPADATESGATGSVARHDVLLRAAEALEGKVASVLVTAVRGV
jgi:SAM-dependent methyltransferase